MLVTQQPLDHAHRCRRRAHRDVDLRGIAGIHALAANQADARLQPHVPETRAELSHLRRVLQSMKHKPTVC